eukprot:TRINITY_DN35632_c0_g1_i1.p1 TRINITY_DN35632_c0_g1~~TRINITY_DN35632_c0_g1_i1.p1  ORF type:complete len:370 (-),score=-1.20 TRINITY_DN35632_c0_g1_i1:82-1191(-)
MFEAAPLPPAPITGTELHTRVAIVSILGGILGCIGSGALIATHLLWKETRTPARALVFYLSICDFLQGLRFATIPLDSVSRGLCISQGMLGIFAAVGSFAWTTTIAVFVFFSIVNSRKGFSTRGTLIAHAICWGYPIIICVILLPLSITKPDFLRYSGEPWCFVNNAHAYDVWTVLAYAGPLVVAWGLSSILYLVTWVVVRKKSQEEERRGYNMSDNMELREIRLKLILVPLVFVLCRGWGCVWHVVVAFTPGHGQHGHGPSQAEGLQGAWAVIQLLIVLGDATQGFWNWLIFAALTTTLRTRFQEKIAQFRGKTTTTTPQTDATASLCTVGNYNYSTPTHFPRTPECAPVEQTPLLIRSSSPHTNCRL